METTDTSPAPLGEGGRSRLRRDGRPSAAVPTAPCTSAVCISFAKLTNVSLVSLCVY